MIVSIRIVRDNWIEAKEKIDAWFAIEENFDWFTIRFGAAAIASAFGVVLYHIFFP